MILKSYTKGGKLMGSVKDLDVLKEAGNKKPGIGRFIFSDRYSVFDWGEMPDHIPGKGKALSILTAYFFEKLEKQTMSFEYFNATELASYKATHNPVPADIDSDMWRIIFDNFGFRFNFISNNHKLFNA